MKRRDQLRSVLLGVGAAAMSMMAERDRELPARIGSWGLARLRRAAAGT